MLSLKKLTFGRRRSSRDASLDLSSSLNTLEARLSEKTDLIDEMKKIVPLDVEAPGVILLGFAGSGKSTILEALTGVPLPRSAPCKAARKMLKIRINSDPTCSKYVFWGGGREGGKEGARPRQGGRRERRGGRRGSGTRVSSLCRSPTINPQLTNGYVPPYFHSRTHTHVQPPSLPPLRTYALVSLTDPTCKDDKQTRRVNNMDDLPRVLAALQKKKLPPAGGLSVDYSDFPIEEEEEGGDEHSVASNTNSSSSAAAAEESRRRILGTPFEAIYVRVLRPSGPTYNVIELPGLPPHSSSSSRSSSSSSSSTGKEEEDEATATYEGQLRQVLREHPAHLILALVEVPDLFDRAKAVQMAKSVDPESRRTLGVSLPPSLLPTIPPSIPYS